MLNADPGLGGSEPTVIDFINIYGSYFDNSRTVLTSFKAITTCLGHKESSLEACILDVKQEVRICLRKVYSVTGEICYTEK